MKKLMTLVLAAGMFVAAAAPASAIEFKAEGEWLMGFAVGDADFVKKVDGKKINNNDKFTAGQRVRLQLEAVANENLSGTVAFEIGDNTWGNSETGGALGADSVCVELKNAYIDWAIPDTELSVRMGIQAVVLPSVAGGSAILDDDVAGIIASYKFTDEIALSAMWFRPDNDNFGGDDEDSATYLDNVDLIALALDMNFDGFQITPWVMYGMMGRNNQFYGDHYDGRFNTADYDGRSGQYANAFWAGIPFVISAFDPLNIEVDLNYGYMDSMGKGWLEKADGSLKRYDTKMEGWLAKALVEYAMDWGTPGIFGWYASGDDSNPKNGSERMPTVSPCNGFTPFMGDGNFAWSSGALYDLNLDFAGTWGIGIQIADMSFIEDLSHTFSVTYWGGTNSPSMAKYASLASAWGYDSDNAYMEGLYLTTNDAILEFNLVSSYQMYENFEINLELGYLVNFIDHDTWKKANGGNNYSKQDAWKAQVIFAYSF